MEFNLVGYKHGNAICDTWKFGLGLTLDENGLITRHEIKTKIKTMLCDKGEQKKNKCTEAEGNR
jgi:hypothetical protein